MNDALSFVRRRLDLTITLGAGAFGNTLSDTITLTGLRMSADIAFAGGESMGALQVRAYGIKQAIMNQLTTIGTVATQLLGQNKILVAAGDDENGMQEVYRGSIAQAWGDYNAAPDVAFNVIAYAGYEAALKPVNAVSYRGSTDVAGIMQTLATTMGYGFENQGVTGQLSNPYFSGTAYSQMRACARAAGISAVIDRTKLVISPGVGKPMTVGAIPLVSPDTGMVGYPAFSSKSISIKTVFNPNITMPGKIQVASSIPMACGIFRTYSVGHSLSSETPGGPWFSNVECYPDA